MTDTAAALVWCPFPDKDGAREVAATVVQEKLAACANIVPAIESIFEWEGRVSNEQEVVVLFKTTSTQMDKLIIRLGDCHPYDTPAIIGWRCDAAHPATLQWLGETLGSA